jgi:hypothetical protein
MFTLTLIIKMQMFFFLLLKNDTQNPTKFSYAFELAQLNS